MTSVSNLPNDVKTWVVARNCAGEWWFWGSWDDRSKAQAAADDVIGVVVHRDDIYC